MLVTFSTNSTPGGGAKGDVLYIDDVALVYNAAITGITVKGTALEGFAQDVYEYSFELADGETIADSDIDATFISEHAYLVKKVIETSDGYKVIVAVISNDLNTVKAYTINYTKTSTVVPGDVNGDGNVTSADITALYNYILSGSDSDIVNGDQDNDGQITTHDVTCVYEILLGV